MTTKDYQCGMWELAFDKGVSYEFVEFMCQYCEEKLHLSWKDTLDLVRRTLL